MKNIIFIIFIISSTFSFSQECKYEINLVDEFTKNKILETKTEWLGENLAYSFKKINEVIYLRLETHYSKVFSIKDGAKIMFLTDKETPITMEFPKYEVSKMSSINNFYIVEYLNITNEVLLRFKNEKISKIRIYSTDGYFDKEIKDKRDKKFKELLKCIE